MTDYLLDTNIVSELIKRPDGLAAGRIWDRAHQSCTSIIVAGELWFGVSKNASRRRAQLLEQVLNALPVRPLEHPTELLYARLRADLERAGTPIGNNDLLIAAHALALDCTLVSANERELRRVPGLRVENWLS